MVDDYPWWVMVDHGNGLELGAWYDDRNDAEKEVEFHRSQGRRAELRRNGGTK
jgi:hypothetical protein